MSKHSSKPGDVKPTPFAIVGEIEKAAGDDAAIIETIMGSDVLREEVVRKVEQKEGLKVGETRVEKLTPAEQERIAQNAAEVRAKSVLAKKVGS